jgi:microcystin-dependent protein
MATYSYTVTASGNDHYLWSGHGLVDAPDPNLSFQDGDVITITNVSGGHIMRLIPDNDPSGSVDASSENNGTTFLFFDPMLEGSYTYVCTNHPSMTGSITVYKKHIGQGSTHRYLVEIDSSQDKYLWYDGLEVIDGAIRSVNTEPNFLGDAPSINIPVGDTLQIFEYRSVASFSQLELSATPTIKNIKRAYRVMFNREFDVPGLNNYYGNSNFPTLFDVVADMGASPEYLGNLVPSFIPNRLYYHLMRISLLSGVDVARMDDWESYVRSREDLLNSWDPVNGGTLSDFGENHAESEGSYKAYPLLSHTFQEIQSITYRPIHGNFDQGENIISVFNRKPLSLASRKVSIENVRSKINDIINSGDQSVSIGDEPQDPRSGDIWFNGSSLMIYLGLDLITEDGQNSFVTEEDLMNLDLERISPWFEVSGDSGSGPTASIISYAGSSAPTGYLLCDGAAKSRTTYAALYAALGGADSPYGQGDGSTTFNVPDLRGRVIAGQDDMGEASANRLTTAKSGVNGDNLGATGGSEDHQLTIAEIPSHRHTDSFSQGGNGSGYPGFDGSGDKITSGTTGLTGLDGFHNNVQPTIILNYIIKV